MVQALFEQAARLNNDGIDAFRQGRSDLAYKTLTHALRMLKARLVALGSRTSERSRISQQKQSSTTPRTTAKIRMNTTPTMTAVPNLNRTMTASSDAIFFNHAIRVVIITAPENSNNSILVVSEDEENQEFCFSTCCAMIVVFNLALVKHITGTTASSSPSSCLIKAEALYGKVLEILDNYRSCSFFRLLLGEDMMRIRLACINNLSHIRSLRGDSSNAVRRELMYISALLFRQEEGSPPPSTTRLLGEPNNRALLLILIMQLEAPPNPSAPAA